jgi:hypothetical protein
MDKRRKGNSIRERGFWVSWWCDGQVYVKFDLPPHKGGTENVQRGPEREVDKIGDFVSKKISANSQE